MTFARSFSGVIGAAALIILGCDRPSAEPRQESLAANAAPASPGSRIASACSATVAPRVSRDSIGPIDTRSPLGALKQQCAGTDTTYSGPESAFPGVVFHFDSLLVIGFQYSDSLDLMQPASAWAAIGCGGRLADNVSTCATWQDIVAVFGRSGSGTTEDRWASVTLERLAGFELTFDVTFEEVGSLEVLPNLESMPASAKLLGVTFK